MPPLLLVFMTELLQTLHRNMCKYLCICMYSIWMYTFIDMHFTLLRFRREQLFLSLTIQSAWISMMHIYAKV